MFHLGWFIGRGYSVQAWNAPWSGTIGTDYMQPDIYVDLVRALERACFDYVMIEDGSFVPDAFQNSADWYLRNASTVPKHDPMPLVPLLAQATNHVGIIATMTTGVLPAVSCRALGGNPRPFNEGSSGSQPCYGTQ